MKKRQYILLLLLVVFITGYIKFQRDHANTYNFKSISYYQVYSLDKPETISFCNERVPLESAEVSEHLDNQMHHFSYLRKNTGQIIERVNQWFPLFEEILKQHNIPDDFKYLAVVESNLTNAVSNKGAAGFWQLLPATAQSMGLIVNEEIDERYDPIKATHAACKYLKIAHKDFGNWTNVAASYNIGIAGLKRQLKMQRKQSFYELRLNQQTQEYIYRILAIKEIVENSEKYGFDKSGKKRIAAHKKIKINAPIDNLTNYFNDLGYTYEDVKVLNPWIISNSLGVKSEIDNFYINLPKEKTFVDSDTSFVPVKEESNIFKLFLP